jgi:hypothetical protein
MNSYASIRGQEKSLIKNQLHSSFPIIQAVIEGIQQGEIFKSAYGDYWVLHKAGLSEVFLTSDNGKELIDFIIENNTLPTYFHIYNPTEKLLDLFKPNSEAFNIRERKRVQLQYDGNPNESLFSLNSEFAFAQVTSDNIDSLSIFNLDLPNKFWSNGEEFVKNALAVFIEDKQNNPVSLCYAAAVADRKAEIDVVTVENERGKGLAKSVVAAFISNCINNKVIPNWDCFENNVQSLGTALRLGFIEHTLYKFISVYRK